MSKIEELNQLINKNNGTFAVPHYNIRIIAPVAGKLREVDLMYVQANGVCLVRNPHNKRSTIQISLTEKFAKMVLEKHAIFEARQKETVKTSQAEVDKIPPDQKPIKM